MPRRANLTIVADDQLQEFRRRLLEWFRAHRRDLDWRRTGDPYRIWISEVMLQQTRVAAVIPYYQKFLAEFPSVRHLARARLPRVLRRWAGLGYYSRARNLHRAAKEIVARHNGQFPRGRDAALALPGIGQYTAAAVLSIAYGLPHAVVDGNVARVLARLGAVRGDLREAGRWAQLSTVASRLLASEAAGDWNQAMMELGATVCTPREPKCKTCPVSNWCRAHALGVAGKLPAGRAKPKAVAVRLVAVVLLDIRERTLLFRKENGDGALFSRLWQFPAAEATRKPRLEAERMLRHTLSVAQFRLEVLRSVRHAVTFRRITVMPFLVRVAALPAVEGARAVALQDLERLPVSSATRKIAREALAALRAPQ